MNGRTDWTPEKEEKFLKRLAATGGNVSAACKTLKIARSTAYGHKKQSKEFSAAWDEAIEKGTDDLEQEARRRAIKGTLEPVYYQGKHVGDVRKYSDTLLIFLLKGNRPEKFKERHELTGAEGQPLFPKDVSVTINAIYGDDGDEA